MFKKILWSAFVMFLFMTITSANAVDAKILTPDNKAFHYAGRIDFSDKLNPILAGAGACITTQIQGSSCEITLKDLSEGENHNYIAIIIDGVYQSRVQVSREQSSIVVAENLDNKKHTLMICKSTEAMIGNIEFSGIKCKKISKLENLPKRKIEFIGDSITSTTGLDTDQAPCRPGPWYVHQNAWFGYGPVAARELNAEWMLSSVSGAGIYRTWNKPGPSVPAVYDNLYLGPDSTKKWNFSSYIPDLVSICLGTNDFSNGDGSYNRPQTDSTTFVNSYINFIKTIHSYYPDAKFCLLTSPLYAGENNTAKGIESYIKAVIAEIKKMENAPAVDMFVFKITRNKGCSGHPNKAQQQEIADELVPFYKQVAGWN